MPLALGAIEARTHADDLAAQSLLRISVEHDLARDPLLYLAQAAFRDIDLDEEGREIRELDQRRRRAHHVARLGRLGDRRPIDGRCDRHVGERERERRHLGLRGACVRVGGLRFDVGGLHLLLERLHARALVIGFGLRFTASGDELGRAIELLLRLGEVGARDARSRPRRCGSRARRRGASLRGSDRAPLIRGIELEDHRARFHRFPLTDVDLGDAAHDLSADFGDHLRNDIARGGEIDARLGRRNEADLRERDLCLPELRLGVRLGPRAYSDHRDDADDRRGDGADAAAGTTRRRHIARDTERRQIGGESVTLTGSRGGSFFHDPHRSDAMAGSTRGSGGCKGSRCEPRRL